MTGKRGARVQLDQELTFREAALALGRKRDPHGRKLRNMVLAREAQLAKWIAVRLQGQTEPKLRVTLAALYRHFPELRATRVDGVAQMLRPLVARMQENLAELVDARARDLVLEILREEIEPRLIRLENKARTEPKPDL